VYVSNSPLFFVLSVFVSLFPCCWFFCFYHSMTADAPQIQPTRTYARCRSALSLTALLCRPFGFCLTLFSCLPFLLLPFAHRSALLARTQSITLSLSLTRYTFQSFTLLLHPRAHCLVPVVLFMFHPSPSSFGPAHTIDRGPSRGISKSYTRSTILPTVLSIYPSLSLSVHGPIGSPLAADIDHE
jgi:hypothetical protein